jgi:acylpyruvate hydrolase
VKILCVGRNYAKHAKELGNAVPESPIWFWKPDSAIVPDGAAIELPAGIGPVHHEVELAVRVAKPMRRLDAATALRHVDAVTVANDLTARDLQEKAKKAGLPWAQAKGYDTFLPLGAFVPWDGRDLQALELRLVIDGQVRQHGHTRDMVFGVAQLLAHASTWTTLKPGDVVLTGTPDGVGPVAAGQRVACELVGLAKLSNPVVQG